MEQPLTYNQLLQEVEKIPVVESRIESKVLKEFVVKSDFITQLHLSFQDFFGPDFKAPGELPSFEDKKRSAALGGIREDQTLYYSEKDGYSHCAMLWPWVDGRRYTVKIANSRLSK